MPPQGLGLGPSQTWVTQQGQRPHPGLGKGTVCRTSGSDYLVSSPIVIKGVPLLPIPG